MRYVFNKIRLAHLGLAGAAVAMLAAAPVARAQDCPANASPYRTDDSATETVVHCKCNPGYEIAGDECKLRQTPAVTREKPKDPCAAQQRQADLDLERVKKLRDQAEANQEDLREWEKMNADAQREALIDAAKYFAGEYAENLLESQRSLSKLEQQAKKLAEAANAYGPRSKARKQYAAELASLLNDMRPQMTDVIGRQAAKSALDAQKVWELGRDTMHADVGAAAQQNDKLRAFLANPKFHGAFAADNDTESANAELFKTMEDAAVERLSQSKTFLAKYSKITGPTVRAGEFVVDLVYDDAKNWVGKEGVVQTSNVAGDFARATAALQKRYKASIDALQACKAGD